MPGAGDAPGKKRSAWAQDDVGAYHLFYLDDRHCGHRPDFLRTARTTRHAQHHSYNAAFVWMAEFSLDWWVQHFKAEGVAAGGVFRCDGRYTRWILKILKTSSFR